MFIASFSPGDYELTIDLKRADGKKSNVQGKVEFSDKFGEITSRKVHVNEIDFSAKGIETVPFASDQKILVKVVASDDTDLMQATFKIVKK